MKKIKFNPVSFLLSNFFMLATVFFISSCSESDDRVGNTDRAPYKCLDCKTQPEAKAENDNSYKGIYVGVGTRGPVIVDVGNSDENLTSKWTIDGNTFDMVAKDILNDGSGLYVATFEGQYNNAPISFKFSVEENGKNPKISSDFVADRFSVDKETSDSMLEVFDGVWTERVKKGNVGDLARVINDTLINNTDTTLVVGKFNMIVARSLNQEPWWKGVNKLNGGLLYPVGVINAANQMLDDNNNFIGIIREDELNGVIKGTSNQTIYLTSRRKL